MSDTKAEQIKTIAKTFKADWEKESDLLDSVTSKDWHANKKLAEVKSAGFFAKSNNIGPKMDKMQAARAKFTKQVNQRNYQSLTGSIIDLNKAFDDFRKNRKGATPEQTKKVNEVLDVYEHMTKSALKFLASKDKQVAILDKVEASGILDDINPAH